MTVKRACVLKVCNAIKEVLQASGCITDRLGKDGNVNVGSSEERGRRDWHAVDDGGEKEQKNVQCTG